MDWFSWLSKTGLDGSLVYEYGLIFTRNELEEEDLISFNHEFLQSMGISVAKHRLEILKLARKEVEKSPQTISRLFFALNKAKRRFIKKIGEWVFPKDLAHTTRPEVALRKHNISKEFNQEKVMATNRSIFRSGPLDRRTQESLMVTSRSLSVSGPLDGEVQESLMSINGSTTVSGPLDGRLQERYLFANKHPDVSWPLDESDLGLKINGVQSLWSLMFQDMKPT